MLASASGAAVAGAGNAFAQSAGAAEPAKPAAGAPSKPDATLEEIVVTADRKGYGADLVQAGSFRGARQIETPLTVSVIPQQVLVTQQARGLLDALRNTAGVTSAQTSTTVYNNLSIRGIAVENRGNFRLNGSLPIVNLIDLPLEDKDRVEALKGASALYYGFTTPAGIINLTMKRPTLAPMLDAEVFGDNHGSVGGHVDAGGTWGMFGARTNLVYEGVDSGIQHTWGERYLISGAFDIKPTDRLTISADFERIEKVVPEPTVFKFAAPKSTAANPYPAIVLPPLIDPAVNLGSDWMKNQAHETNVLGHVNYKLNDSWAITVDAGTSRADRTRRFSTFTPTNLVTGDGTESITLQNFNTYRNNNFRAEVAGAFFTGPIKHEVMVGASDNIREQFNANSLNGLCPGAKAPVACAQNMFNPGGIPEIALGPSVGVTTGIDDRGLYAFDRAKWGWLSVLGGLRQSDYREYNTTTSQTTFHARPLSGSWGVVIQPRSWVSVYGTYIEGLESTPAAPITAANAQQAFPATNSTQYEGGIKYEPIRGLLAQAAYFDIERGSTYVNGANVYVQDGRARYRGGEFSLTGEINRYFSVYASALLLDAQQISGAPTIISGTTVTPSVVGKQIENAPKTTFSIAGEYRVGPRLPGLSFTAAVYYTGARAVNNLNQAFVPAFTLLDLGAAYSTSRFFGRAMTFRVNADNVANVRYWASSGNLTAAQGTPQTVKFAILTHF
ncbi:MAG TPA: TonB-dependent siderophore receptor [Caulobacteraceae bacterium]